MRFLKFLLFLVILAGIVVGGLWYATQLGWNMTNFTALFMDSTQNQGQQAQHQMPGMPGMGAPAPSAFNLTADQNRNKLNQALGSLNQALDLITTDPYSQITLPNRMSEYPRETTPSTAPGTTNKENITINITPPGTTTPPGTAAQPGTQTPIVSGNPPLKDLPPTVNIVFDQYKLEQVHEGIFKLSQATMMLSELNNDLADQSVLGETNPPTQQTFMTRYNLTLQNRNKLTQATRLLREASVLVNVNPYAPQSGYVFSSQRMQQLHQGISELAKSTVMFNRLAEDFNQQMMSNANDYRVAMYNLNNMTEMTQHGGGWSLFSGMGNNTWILNLGFLLVVLGIVFGVLILIQRLIRDTISAPADNENKRY